MKLLWSGAAALIAASTMVLGGCAADQQKVAEKEADKSACLGVAPATGSMLRRKEECGASTQGGGIPQDVQDEIRRAAQNNGSRPSSLGR